MKHDPSVARGDRAASEQSDASTRVLPGGGAQTEQEPARAHRATAGAGRPDDEIRAALGALLRASDWVDTTAVELLVTSGVVAMLGEVADYPAKRALERAVADVPGVREIHDQLQVRSSSLDTGAAGLRGDAPPSGSPSRVV